MEPTVDAPAEFAVLLTTPLVVIADETLPEPAVLLLDGVVLAELEVFDGLREAEPPFWFPPKPIPVVVSPVAFIPALGADWLEPAPESALRAGTSASTIRLQPANVNTMTVPRAAWVTPVGLWWMTLARVFGEGRGRYGMADRG